MNDLKLRIGRDGTFYDYSDLIKKAVWSGRKSAAPRTVEITLVDTVDTARSQIVSGNGLDVYFYLDSEELFRGLLMSDTRGSSHTIKIKAYDECVRLTNNKDSFSFKKKTATYIFKFCLKSLGLTLGTAATTSHKIGEIVKKATTYWDVIEDALEQTYKATGNHYYVYSKKGKVYLKKRKASSTMLLLSQESNVQSYDFTRSIYDTRTRLKLTTSKGAKKGSTTISALEKKIGKFQEVETVDEDITQTEIKQRIKVFKAEEGKVSRELTVTATGDASCISGACVYVDIGGIGAKRIMYIDEDTHTFEDGKHTMKLKLSYDSTS